MRAEMENLLPGFCPTLAERVAAMNLARRLWQSRCKIVGSNDPMVKRLEKQFVSCWMAAQDGHESMWKAKSRNAA